MAVLLTLTPFLEYPNLEVILYRPDGEEERSLTITIGTMERHFMVTLHIRQPAAASQYRIRDVIHMERNTANTRRGVCLAGVA
ncbi:MAG: hypothetical protein U0559_09445 [Anaerolineae bacterium]